MKTTPSILKWTKYVLMTAGCALALAHLNAVAFDDSFDNSYASNAWKNVEALLFPQSEDEPFYTTDALLVVQNGQIQYEKYWNGNSEQTSHINWSISKSISSLIWGAALQRGDVNLNTSICKITPQYKDSLDCRLTWRHLLDWSSGLSFLESYEGEGDRTLSSVGQMLYGDGKGNSVEFVLGHSQIYPPGTHYYYSTGDSSIVLGLLKYVYGDIRYSTLPHEFLFDPLEMKAAAFEVDSSGHFLGGSSAYLSARDLAKIGQLVMNKGRWKNRQIVPSKFIDYLLTENPNWTGLEDPTDKWIPLRQWWKPDLKALGLDLDPTFPQDVYAARGHWGQYLVMIPSKNLVIVRYGLDQEGRVDIIEVLKRVLFTLEINQ